MEFIKGHNLKEFIKKKGGRVGLTQIQFIVKEILNGLQFLHENEIIHRNVNPINIIITNDEKEVKILDYGGPTIVIFFINKSLKIIRKFSKRLILTAHLGIALLK